MEDFGRPPWSAVTAPFSRSVLYYHQYAFRLVAAGLVPAWPAPLSTTTFGRAGTEYVADAWSGWIDASTEATIGASIAVSTVERYQTADTTRWVGEGPLWISIRFYHQWLWQVALVGIPDPSALGVSRTSFNRSSEDAGTAAWTNWLDDGSPLAVTEIYSPAPRERYRALDPTSWTVLSAGDVTIAYVHEMRPAVRLLGTDGAHTVGVTVHSQAPQRRVEGLQGQWTDWIEVGSTLVFDAKTSGLIPLVTRDPTTYQVDSPFDATIAYAAPLEMNLKPFFSAAFVAILVGVGSAAAYRRPLAFAGNRRTKEVGPAATLKRVKRDRWHTALLIIVPVAATEGAIGIASFFTGLLRIPDAGSWLSLGLVLNTAITVAGLTGQIVSRHRGYRAKVEVDRAARESALLARPPPPPDAQ